MVRNIFKEKRFETLMKERKKQRLLLIISEIKKGNNPAKISKEQKINKKTLQNYLRQLKKMGCIQKEGYGVWKVLKEVLFSSKATSLQKQIRGHAFNWKVRFNKEINWKRRLEKYNISYQLIGINNSTPRIIFNGKKIWFTKTGLVIYEPKSFFSKSSFTSKGQAVWELDKTIKMLGRQLKIDLTHYYFTTSREHYGMIKNELAKQYNEDGEKLYIVDDKGIWMWIDFSHSIHELETNDPKNSRGVQNWFNDMKKHDFKVTPSFLMENINNVTKNQQMFNQNFESHIKAIQSLSSGVKKMSKEIIRLNKIISSLKN